VGIPDPENGEKKQILQAVRCSTINSSDVLSNGSSSKLDDPVSGRGDTKPPEELTQLYMSHLYKHLMWTLGERLSSSVVESTPIDFVLTVPAIWSNAAKQKTETAAVRAGFKATKGRKIHLVSEPEAAAIYTLHNLGQSRLNIGGTFVVCDAGGGTVDLISYKILQLSPSLQVREATAGTGAKCGSSMLNGRFRKYLKQKHGEGYWTADRLVEANNAFEDVSVHLALHLAVF